MTPHEIGLVRASFGPVIVASDRAGRIFYERLFALAPAVRPLFPADMTGQQRKLMLTLATAVHDLDRLDRLLPAVTELAKRHRGYGALDAHFPVVGEALLHMLGEVLGPRFTDETRAVWTRAYGLLSNAMMTAAREAA